jgi:two-component system, sensor histidine kinase PdtaS
MKRILIVDNSEILRTYLRNLLHGMGHEPITAADGISGLKKAMCERPDVIFIDLVMPKMSGEKLVTLLRQEEATKAAYLVILSGIAAESRLDWIALGADACIAKGPLDRMRNHIERVLAESDLPPAERSLDVILGLEDVFKREVTQELLTSRRHAEVVMENIGEGIIEMTPSYEIVYVNKAAANIFGMEEHDMLAVPFPDLFPAGEDRERILWLIGIEEPKAPPYRPECLLTIRGVNHSVSSYRINDDGNVSLLVMIRDVTASQKALEEKNVLLREIHHRIKNNLLMITSIVNLERDRMRHQEDAELLDRICNRINSISLLHEKLYMSTDLRYIPMQEFVEDLCVNLTTVLLADPGRIHLCVDAADTTFNMNTSMPIAFIITELLTNALKYAFPDGRKGTIEVLFEKVTDPEADTSSGTETDTCTDTQESLSTFLLTVKDDGVGIPSDLSVPDSDTLGLRLVQEFSIQLDGRLEVESGVGRGTTFTVEFTSLP